MKDLKQRIADTLRELTGEHHAELAAERVLALFADPEPPINQHELDELLQERESLREMIAQQDSNRKALWWQAQDAEKERDALKAELAEARREGTHWRSETDAFKARDDRQIRELQEART
jgi:hypothetical protein